MSAVVSRESLRSVFDALPFPCLLLDTDLVITEVSGAYTTTMGRSRADLVGRYLFEAFPLSEADGHDDDSVHRTHSTDGTDAQQQAATGADPLTLVRASMLRVLATGQPDPVPLQKYDIPDPDSATGFTERWWSFTTFPLTEPAPTGTAAATTGGRANKTVGGAVGGAEGGTAGRTTDGAARHVGDHSGEQRGTPLVVGLLHVTEDVTDQVRHSSRTLAEGPAAVAEQVQRSTALLRGRTQQLEADLYARAVQVQALTAAREAAAARASGLAHTALALSQASTVAELADLITEHGLAVTGCDSGAVALFAAEDPTMMDLTITDGFGAATQRDYSRLPAASHLPACVAARTGQQVLLGDAEASTAWGPEMTAVMASTGSQAFACLPLMAHGQPIGSLTAGWRQPQDFDAEQLQLLAAFAAQCAQVLQRLRVAEAERAAARAAHLSAQRQAALVAIAQALAGAEGRDDVLDVLADQGRALLGANGCGLCLRPAATEHAAARTMNRTLNESAGAGKQAGSVPGFIDTVVTDSYAEVRHSVQRVPADFPLPAIRSAATGAEIFMVDRDSTEAAFPGSRAIYEGAGVQASAALPLRARGQLLGCLSVGFAQTRDWSEAEQELLRAFAALTAQALDRIAARDGQQQAAAATAAAYVTLQRSMLTEPPEPDHMQIVVRYRPAAAAAQVGGDWYDAFLQPQGGSGAVLRPGSQVSLAGEAVAEPVSAATVLVIGDVVGHDTSAAAAMGQIRATLRAIAVDGGRGPAAVLAATDAALPALMVPTTATAVVARLEQTPEQRQRGVTRLRWSNAGHLPPVLIDTDGSVTELASVEPDLLLGIFPETGRHESVVTVDRGATVLLFTDGLVERRGESLEVGLERLRRVLGELHTPAAGAHDPGSPGLDVLVDELLERMVAQHPDDDVALIAVRLHPQDRPRPVEAGPQRLPEHVAAE